MAKKKMKRKSTRKSRVVRKPKGKPKGKPKAEATVRSKPAKPKPKPALRRPRGGPVEGDVASYERRGLGARSGGQSGDTQGIHARPAGDSESVEELLEEGQSYEAEIVDGVENAPEPDQGEVRTHEVEEDDVPEEYREKD
jgi:hypothetical protein